jgi:hypothetical protein
MFGDHQAGKARAYRELRGENVSGMPCVDFSINTMILQFVLVIVKLSFLIYARAAN